MNSRTSTSVLGTPRSGSKDVATLLFVNDAFALISRAKKQTEKPELHYGHTGLAQSSHGLALI